MPTDPSPDVEFDWMLWFWFSLGWLANLHITSGAEVLEGKWTFVAENNVIKCFLSVLNPVHKFQSFNLVHVADKLAVLWLLKCPPFLFAQSPDCGGMDINASFWKLLLDLVADWLVFSYFCHLLRSTWFRKVFDGSSTYKLLNDAGDSWKTGRKRFFLNFFGKFLPALNLLYGEL